MKNSVHNYYVRCTCDALYSDPIEKCPACGKPNPELAKNAAAPVTEEKKV